MQSLLGSMPDAGLHASGRLQSPLVHWQAKYICRTCSALHHTLLPSESSAVLQLGTHLRAKRKREEMSVLLRKAKK